MKKGIIILGSVMLGLVVLLIIISTGKSDSDDNELIAILEYGHNDAIDASMHCEYDIYKKRKGKYTYDLECINYTITGEQPPKKIESGTISSEQDIKKLKEKIDTFKKQHTYAYDSYYYIQDYERRKYNDFDSLLKQLY